MATSSGKLENCEVCAINKAKYTCPKCEVRTCSLTCVNIHKKELECHGVRDKVKFVPLNAFTDLDLLSDYRLLEEIGRSVNQFQHDPLKKCTRENNLPVHLTRLRSAAYEKGIQLEFMPQHFTKHKENTTFLKWKTNELFWRIEWIFPQAENTKWISKRAQDTIRLSDLLQSILNPDNTTLESSADENLDVKALLQDKLEFYRADLARIKVLLKAEKVKNSDSRFYELDITATLSENFARKTIIEFPTLYVILKDHSDMYETLDSDAENVVEHQGRHRAKRRQAAVKQEQQTRQTNHEDKNSSVNFFFNDESADSDEHMQNSNSSVKTERSTEFNLPEYSELVRMEY